MNILIINCSPVKNGATAEIVNLVSTYTKINNEETAATAQEMFEKDKILFDVYRSTDKDRLIAYAKRLKELREMEEGDI